MSTQMGSRDSAFLYGLFVVGRCDLYCIGYENDEQWKAMKEHKMYSTLKEVMDAHPGEITLIAEEAAQFGQPLDDSLLIEVKGHDGEPVRIGSAKFRDGFDCWVFGANGMGMRL